MPRSASRPTLRNILTRLRKRYGAPEPPSITDPFQQILLEQVAYLATDEKRQAAFELLRSKVGLTPERILAAPEETLLEATTAGGSIAARQRAGRLQESAERALSSFGADLRGVLSRSVELSRAEWRTLLPADVDLNR